MVAPTNPKEYPPISCFDEMFEVKVGTGNELPFKVYKGVASFYSDYFKKSLKPEEVNRRGANPVDLHDESVDVFRAFLRWIHFRDFLLVGESKNIQGGIVELYEFAGNRITPMLRNAIIDHFHRNENLLLDSGVMEKIYNLKPAGCGLQRWSSDRAARMMHLSVPTINKAAESWPKDVLLDVMKAMAPDQKGRVFDDDACKYHEHPAGEWKCLPSS